MTWAYQGHTFILILSTNEKLRFMTLMFEYDTRHCCLSRDISHRIILNWTVIDVGCAYFNCPIGSLPIFCIKLGFLPQRWAMTKYQPVESWCIQCPVRKPQHMRLYGVPQWRGPIQTSHHFHWKAHNSIPLNFTKTSRKSRRTVEQLYIVSG